MDKICKYEPKYTPVTPKDLEVATDTVLQIVKTFVANFQNNEDDFARLITDGFTLRSELT